MNSRNEKLCANTMITYKEKFEEVDNIVKAVEEDVEEEVEEDVEEEVEEDVEEEVLRYEHLHERIA